MTSYEKRLKIQNKHQHQKSDNFSPIAGLISLYLSDLPRDYILFDVSVFSFVVCTNQKSCANVKKYVSDRLSEHSIHYLASIIVRAF